MFERFTDECCEKVRRAIGLAEAEGAATIEVEHLFLAFVDPVTDRVGLALQNEGIDRWTITAARDREFRSALAVAGVSTERAAPPGAPRLRRGRHTRFAASAKLALERSLAIAVSTGERRITNETLLLAILAAEVGVMPRLLAELGTDVDAIERAVRDTN